MLKVLKSNLEVIQLLLSLAIVLIMASGFWLTYVQLSRTEQTLRAANTYQVQKDVRALLNQVLTNDFRSDLYRPNNDGLSEESLDKLWLILNLYLSVYRQAIAEGLSSQFVESFRRDYCQFLRIPGVERGWEQLLEGGRIGDAHLGVRRAWCSEI